MIILSGPSGPKFIADAFVVSENVGDGGPGEDLRFGEIARERSERALCMFVGTREVAVVVVVVVGEEDGGGAQ